MQQDVGRRLGEHAGHLTHRLERGSLGVSGSAQIAGANLHFQPRRHRRLRVVRDRVLGDDVVGNDDEVAGLGAQLGRAPRDLGHPALELADANPVADTKRLLALDAKTGKGVPERVLERKPDDHGADSRRGEELVFEDERRDQHQQPDDHRILEDGWKRIGHPIGAQRIDEDVDEQVDGGGGKDEPFEPAQVAVGARNETGPLPDDEVEEDVGGEENEREPELSLDEPVDGEAADRERRGQMPRRP